MKDLSGFRTYMIEEELSPNTIECYMRGVKMFFERFDELNRKNILLWKEQLIREYKPQTVNLRLTSLERYCDYKDVNFKVKRIKEQKAAFIENVITEEQYRRLIDGLKADGEERWAFQIEVLARTGARISEALRLTKGDLIKGYADLPTKGKYRRVYLPRVLLKEAPEYVKKLPPSGRLMVSYCNKPITSKGVAARLKDFGKRYGIPEEVCHPHAFRHFFAIQFLKKNNNLTLLADVLGHSGVNTTMIYTRMSATEQREAVNKAVDW